MQGPHDHPEGIVAKRRVDVIVPHGKPVSDAVRVIGVTKVTSLC